MLREKCLRLTTTIVLPIYPLCSRITRQNMSPCLLNIYAEYIMQNAGVDEAHVLIKILGKISINSDMQMTPH